MTAIILHLSDIHIKSEHDPILTRASNIAACTFSVLPETSVLFVIISGDIAFSGKAAQYDLASGFLSSLKSVIQTEKDIPVHFVIAPGNHDCDFDRDTKMRQMAIKCLTEDGVGAIDDSVIDQCTLPQEEFFKFKKNMSSVTLHTGDKLWETLSFGVDGKAIVFDTLNISWVSRLQEEQGGLVFPHERYSSKESEHADVRILVMHHPLNWFGQGMYKPFRKFVRKLANIVITGHEHQANVGENIDSESSMSAYIEGGILQDNGGIGNSTFNLVTLNLEDGTYSSTQFKWTSKHYEATEEGSWADYRALPAKRLNPFEIQKEFRQLLDDPGANFQHPSRPRISLSDIYVYPDLLEAGSEKRSGSFLSSSSLIDPSKTVDGVLLEGEEKVGRTTLLYRLYDEYHERGFAPLMINGSGIKQIKTRDLDTLIRKAVVEQYGEGGVCTFEQLPVTKKILLLDDFDESRTRAVKDRAEVLRALRGRFAHVVITVGELFEVRETLREAASSELSEFKHYQIQPFGYSLRGKLIQKWFRLGSDGSMDESAMIDKYDQAERIMETVMGRNIIPSMPLYLLTLLQSLEAGRSGEFKESALGFYYEYLLTEGFQSAGVHRDKLTEFFEYCTQLAWFYHTNNNRELSEDELVDFNRSFSAKWHTVDFKERVDILLQAKVLLVHGKYYTFRYPYIYYFLKGRYLSRNLSDIQIREYVEKCCAHLYVREYANTVLFLAHHTNDEFVMRAILESLQGLFNQYKPVTFDNDTAQIAALISDAPKLKYSGTPPETHREQLNKVKDKLDDGQDGLVDKEESGDGLSLIAQLTTLFKTVEILGQVLKNQYARIERSEKIDILGDLFSGPLRALSGFYVFMAENPDSLVAEIDLVLKHRHKLEDEDKRRRKSREIAGRLIQFISLGFICKASSSVSSDALREDIHAAVKRTNTPAFRLIELGVLLDSSDPIPKDVMLKLKEDTEKDVIALSLIRMLTIRHLYMFKTSERDKQWLASKLDLDLALQHVVDFKSAKTKHLK